MTTRDGWSPGGMGCGASMPCMPRMGVSMTTTSGSVSLLAWIAWAPVGASAALAVDVVAERFVAVAGADVADTVGEGFLDEAERAGVHVGGQVVLRALPLRVDADTGVAGAGGELAEPARPGCGPGGAELAWEPG